MVTVKSGEVGTPKGDNKELAKKLKYNLDIINDKYNDVIIKLNAQIHKNCEKNNKN